MFPLLLVLTVNKEYDSYAYLFQTTKTIKLRLTTETFLTVVVVREFHLLERAQGRNAVRL